MALRVKEDLLEIGPTMVHERKIDYCVPTSTTDDNLAMKREVRAEDKHIKEETGLKDTYCIIKKVGLENTYIKEEIQLGGTYIKEEIQTEDTNIKELVIVIDPTILQSRVMPHSHKQPGQVEFGEDFDWSKPVSSTIIFEDDSDGASDSDTSRSKLSRTNAEERAPVEISSDEGTECNRFSRRSVERRRRMELSGLFDRLKDAMDWRPTSPKRRAYESRAKVLSEAAGLCRKLREEEREREALLRHQARLLAKRGALSSDTPPSSIFAPPDGVSKTFEAVYIDSILTLPPFSKVED